MAEKQGPGQIDETIIEPDFGGTADLTVGIRSSLYNYDINDPALKQRHRDWLAENVIPTLKENPGAAISLVGSASRSGEESNNVELSRKRRDGVESFLKDNGVRPGQIPLSPGVGSSLAPQAPKENEHFRAVFLSLFVPVKLKLFLRTDDWTSELSWKDIIGLSEAIKNINIHIKSTGAPPFMMPESLDVNVTTRFSHVGNGARKGNPTISHPLNWQLDKQLVDASHAKDPRAQTDYQYSKPADQVVQDGPQTVATLQRKDDHLGPSTSAGTFREALGWTFRGFAEVGAPEDEQLERPDSLALLQAGGVEVLQVQLDRRKAIRIARLIRSPAQVFYFTGHGGHCERCLLLSADGKVCYRPKFACAGDVTKYWGPAAVTKYSGSSSPKILMLTGCSILDIKGWWKEFGNQRIPEDANKPGLEWAQLLQTRGGPYDILLGYANEAPSDARFGDTIATDFGKVLKGGSSSDIVWSWLYVNGIYRQWNAVGMDKRGYQYLEPREGFFYGHKDFDPMQDIKGPDLIQ
jgi:hypothetical protein